MGFRPKFLDSAIDYRWEVMRTDMSRRRVTVRFSPLDSTDSDRRPQFHDVYFVPGHVSESDLLAGIDALAFQVAYTWNKTTRRLTQDDISIFDRFKGQKTFTPIELDSYPKFNELTFSLGPDSVVESGGYRVHSYNIRALSDSEKADRRDGISMTVPQLWDKLYRTNNLDAAMAEFDLDSFGSLSADEVQMLRGRAIDFGDSVATRIQNNVLFLNDSDMAAWMFFHNDSSVAFPKNPYDPDE